VLGILEKVTDGVSEDKVTTDKESYEPGGSNSRGVTEFDEELANEVPFEFVAVTVKVYSVPFVKPVTVIGLDEPVPVIPSGLDVTVYVAEAPPVAPAVNVTEASALPAVAVPIVGDCGTVVAVTPDEAELADDVPYGLVETTVYVY
jgi:hypothetical protein